MAQGQVVKIHSDFYYIDVNGEIVECKLREVLKKQKQKVFVGDIVDFANGAIEKIHKRKNFITRPAVANIDKIIIISAVKEPELDFVQLNRYIAFAKYHKIETVLCFNKNDLSDNDKTIEKVFSIYEPLGFDILFTSATEGYGLNEFKKILKGKTSVLCGLSGVGKSSLINVACGIQLRTGEVSEKTQRGTHTTRHCEIITIDKNTKIVDTPGFSNLKFDFLLPNEVDLLFDEIGSLKKNCKFQNCLHINETDCAVKAGLGKIDISRYESYVMFVEEAKLYKEKVKYQGVKQESTLKCNNDKLSVKISSRKRHGARNTIKQKIYKDVEDERID